VKKRILYFFPPVSLRPNVGQDLLILEVSRSHTTTHHSRQDSSGRVIDPSQRLLPDSTQHLTTDRHLCPWLDSNPHSQQADPCLTPRGHWDRRI